MAQEALRGKRRQFIRSVGSGTINGLLDELLDRRVLNQEEMEKIRDENSTVMDKARALMDNVIRKGPQACQICIDFICEEDSHLAGTLGISSGLQSGNSQTTQEHQVLVSTFADLRTVQDNAAPILPSGTAEGLKLCPLQKAQSIKKEKETQIYPIMEKSGRTRLALIICNTEFDSLSKRNGADTDIRNMKTLLGSLGYSVAVLENLTASDMKRELVAFAARPEHRTSDSTFLVFMSHGVREGICGTKYSQENPDILDVHTIFQTLNAVHCPNLTDKPKVIIIQACRGEGQGMTWVKDSAEVSDNISPVRPEEFEDDAIKKAHIEKDFIAFCSSTPDNVSWRHPALGSLFIMKLIEKFQEYAWCDDLEEIFRKVRFSFEMPEGRAQMPTAERVTLTRLFYLFPGL
ncbi:PREDICTED: caspase-1-like [Condylura cristata]|uniref:caspase-1-like n=1 Tax=Condylura cristata TaxID=143302 RepID=UPI000643277B|nr:PREDICTED: caspase-1-like [Condylura cristata]